MPPFAPTALLVPEQNIGSIMIWQGAADAVPSSWALCDGTQGTPDLRDKFLLGNSIGTPPEVKGGKVDHVHDFVSTGHDHTLIAGPNLLSGTEYLRDTDTESLSGTTDSKVNLPPYYSLCYIMFVGGD